MKLSVLLQTIGYAISPNDDREITGITIDSRNVQPGFLFAAIKGIHHNGYDSIPDAIEKGAVAIITPSDFKFKSDSDVVTILQDDPSSVVSMLAPIFYDFPAEKMNLIGVTGTNGKTTVTYLLESIYKSYGQKTGVIGTINYRIGDKEFPAINTTPHASELQRLLHEMVDDEVETGIMEVSSHGLALNRTNGCEFDVAVFTNLTQDHLDFHGTIQNYLESKKKLFDQLEAGKKSKKYAVVNKNDVFSETIIKDVKTDVVWYGLNNGSDIYAKNIQVDLKNYTITFDLACKNQDVVSITTHLCALHNVSNICAAAAVSIAQGVPIEIIKKGIENLKGIPGRMEFIRKGQSFAIIVDYAHTEDALERIIDACKNLGFKRIITLFGCGGNRDRKKRPLMGEIAGKGSDMVILTSDNPRDEDVDRILLDIEVGLHRIGYENYEIISDREKAIEAALENAREGDVVILAGKGHETYQIIDDKRIPFSDKEIAIRTVEKLLKKEDTTLFG